MDTIRLAQESDVACLKKLWSDCFGDPQTFIDFYFAARYKADETVVLLQDEEIAAMLTMIPVQTVLPDNRRLPAAMFYAIATDPEHRSRGCAAQLMNFSQESPEVRQTDLAVLVPAQPSLFTYYGKRGFRSGFSIREAQIQREWIEEFSGISGCTIYPIQPAEYNRRRNHQLGGTLYIAYEEADIAYQKSLSQLSGTDICGIDFGAVQGCLALERISEAKVLIKELLLPDRYLKVALKQLALQVPAGEYVLRTPPGQAAELGGKVRPFGMLRIRQDLDATFVNSLNPDSGGYLGLAFD